MSPQPRSVSTGIGSRTAPGKWSRWWAPSCRSRRKSSGSSTQSASAAVSSGSSRIGDSGELQEDMQPSSEDKGLAWQIGVWDGMAQPYEREVDRRFASVVEGVVQRAGLQAGEQVLDLGTGTGAVAIQAASLVGAAGHVTGVDISRKMLALARGRAVALGLRNATFREGRAEAISGDSSCCDVLLASLSLMYVIDRAAAAREIARVLRPGGRFVAAVWAGPADCDIVWFQQTAGNFALPSP